MAITAASGCRPNAARNSTAHSSSWIDRMNAITTRDAAVDAGATCAAARRASRDRHARVAAHQAVEARKPSTSPQRPARGHGGRGEDDRRPRRLEGLEQAGPARRAARSRLVVSAGASARAKNRRATPQAARRAARGRPSRGPARGSAQTPAASRPQQDPAPRAPIGDGARTRARQAPSASISSRVEVVEPSRSPPRRRRPVGAIEHDAAVAQAHEAGEELAGRAPGRGGSCRASAPPRARCA